MKKTDRTSADSIIKDVLDEFLAPSTGNVTIRHALKDYISPCKLFLYMKKARCPSNAPAYYAVDSEATLDETLRGKLILEFPTFTVLTHPMNADVAIIPFDRALFEIDSVPAFSWGLSCIYIEL